MVQFDDFLAMLAQRGVERAELISDRSGCVYSGGQQFVGPTISRSQLRTLIEEIAPPNLHTQLAHATKIDFPYHSTYGTFGISVGNNNGVLALTVKPAPAVDTHITPVPIRDTAVLPLSDMGSGTKRCPYCNEEIKVEAKKCRYYREWLDTPPAALYPAAPAQPVALDMQEAEPTASHTTTQDKVTDTPVPIMNDATGWLILLGIISIGIVAAVVTGPYSPNFTTVSSTVSVGATPTPPPLVGVQFPEINQRYLTIEEVSILPLDRVQDAINELYARHGYPFRGDKGKRFRKYAWYRPVEGRTQEQAEEDFNSFEKANHQLLVRRRDVLKGIAVEDPPSQWFTTEPGLILPPTPLSQ